MKNLSKTEHFENLKVNFRSVAKRAAYEYLVNQQWELRRKIKSVSFEVTMKQREMTELKKQFKGLQSVIEEFRK